MITIIEENVNFMIKKHNIMWKNLFFLLLYNKKDYIKTKQTLIERKYFISKIDFSCKDYILFIYKKGDTTQRTKYYNNFWQIWYYKINIIEEKYKKLCI